MAEPIGSWDEAVAFALSLPDTELSTSYGKGYRYDHDAEGGFSGDNYWPEEMEPQTFYAPTDRGFERRIAERIAWWEEQRARKND